MMGWIDQFAWQVLWAAGARWRSMGGNLRGRRAQFDSGDLAILGLVLVGVVLALVLLSRFSSRKSGGKSYNSPRALFRSLAKAHGLNRVSRRLLQRVARWQRLAHPARLFLEPSRFDPVNLSPKLRAQLTEIHALRDQIFAARIEELDLDQPAGRTPTRSNDRKTARTSSPSNKPSEKIARTPPTSTGAIAPNVQTDVPSIPGSQPISTP